MSVIPKQYDPFTYWNTREHPNTDKAPGIGQDHAAFIQQSISGCTTLLELGPGVGRLFPLYTNLSVSTLDISRNYAAKTAEEAERLGLHVVPYFLDSADADYPFQDKQFDVAISSYVFIHVPFEKIQHAFSEFMRVCNRAVVIVGIEPKWPTGPANATPASHCFTHDYEQLINSVGREIIKRQEFPSARGYLIK